MIRYVREQNMSKLTTSIDQPDQALNWVGSTCFVVFVTETGTATSIYPYTFPLLCF